MLYFGESEVIFLNSENDRYRHCGYYCARKQRRGKVKTISIYSGWKLTTEKKSQPKAGLFPAFVSTFICG